MAGCTSSVDGLGIELIAAMLTVVVGIYGSPGEELLSKEPKLFSSTSRSSSFEVG